MGDMIQFVNAKGDQTDGYLAKSEGGTRGVIVLQEWWGLNDQIKGVADRFADAGYTAMAPDLYEGRVTQDPDEANHMMTGLDWVGATEVDVSGAIAYLKGEGGCDTVCVMGFCMGGALTVIAGVKLEGCDHFASRDDWCTPAAAEDLEEALRSAGVPYEMHRYEGEHAFFNEKSAAYDSAAANLSWQRTIDFMDRNM